MNGGRQPGKSSSRLGWPVQVARTCERAAACRGRPGAWRVLNAAWLLLALPGLAPADAAEPEAAIEAGRAALRQQAFPWYDEQQDCVRRIDVQPAVEPAAHRNSTWHTVPRETGGAGLPELPGWIGPLVRGLIWTTLGLGALVLVGLLLRAYWNRGQRRVATGGKAYPEAGGTADQIAPWVLPVPAPGRDLLDETRRRVAQGDYTHAILYLFSYQLQTLDRHGLIRLARGKTNRQYREELAAEPQLGAILEQAMIGFEDVFFGHHSIERERFEACWSQLDTFHDRIQQARS